MIGFWMLAALTLLAAYAFFLPLLRGRFRRSEVNRQRLNLMLYQQRREELAAESDSAELQSLQAELDKDLLGDLSATETGGGQPSGKGRLVLIVALVAAPLLGGVLYAMLGRIDLADFRAQAPAAQKPVGVAEFEEAIEHLQQRLKQDPNDLKGWLLLGRSYQQIEQFANAADAYAQAMKLAPDNLDIKAHYAEALGDSMEGSYVGEPAKIAQEILAKNPKHHGGLWLAGAAAAQSGDAAQALGYLETLRGDFPKDSPDYKHLSRIIGDLKAGGAAAEGEAEADEGAAELPATGEQKAIQVKVTLADALKAKASPDDIVFIFARAASGPPMPLAIVRKQVKDLPVEVGLDDSMGMVQGMNLSAFDRLVIGARISKTGQALPKPGDLQGLTAPMEIENGGHYAVEIKEEVK